jgi:DNA-binding PadR family transcriptional regulator
VVCDAMKYSENQIRAIKKIERIAQVFTEERWFIQEEIIGAGYKTLQALVNKGFLKTQRVDDVSYYQINIQKD